MPPPPEGVILLDNHLMRDTQMRTLSCRLVAVLLAVALALPAIASRACADPVRYRLDRASSSVGFEADFGTNLVSGTMPVAEANILIDWDRPQSSRVDVSLDLAGARANFPFATEAMLGPRVLDAARHPRITFTSTTVRAVGTEGARAVIDGTATVRGVARPVTLAAEIFRRAGTEAGDRSHLAIHLTGTVHRSEFGASGFPDMVGDDVRLHIVARIDEAG